MNMRDRDRDARKVPTETGQVQMAVIGLDAKNGAN